VRLHAVVAPKSNRDVQRYVEIACAPIVAVILAVGMTWPIAIHARSEVAKDLGDPLFESWQVAWMGHALLHQPLHFFQANMFWPLPDSLAFSDPSVGYAPIGIFAMGGPEAATVVYNVLFLASYALVFLGAYLLAREVGAGRVGAVIAGVAFAYAPWRLAHNGQLNVISSGGIPLSLFLLLRGYRSRSLPLVFAGWIVASWQMTLGWTLGLQFAYMLAVLGAIAALVWFWRGRPRLNGRLAAATALGICLFAVTSFMQARPYLRVIDDHPEARRTPDVVAGYSPPLKGFFAAPENSFFWGDATRSVRNRLGRPWDETALFPGLTIALLAAVGAAANVYPRRLRLGLAAGVVACAVLSVGVRDVSGAKKYVLPYRLLYEFAPGWDGVRTPGRINTLTSLGLALLAGAGACLVLRLARHRITARRERLRDVASFAIAGLLAGAILLEGLGPVAHPNVPDPPKGLRGAVPPLLQLPTDPSQEHRYSYWSTAGFPEMANGHGSFEPTALQELRGIVRTFPDARSVSVLRTLGVRTVVLHPELAAGTPWQEASRRPTLGLGIARKVTGDVVLYHLHSRGRR
jgi:hypothetical protein